MSGAAGFPPGARWRRFDFHAHTPASMDYGKGPNQQVLRARSPREWLLDFMHAAVDCVAITDHDTGEWIDRLKVAYDRLEEERPESFRLLTLFPGVEITVNGGVHLLAILDPSKGRSDIDALLGAVGFPVGKQGTSDGCTSQSVQEVAQIIRERGGLAIPAHADSEKGIFERLDGETLRSLLSEDQLSALEIADPEFDEPEIYLQSGVKLARVLGSDCHHPSGSAGQGFPGSRFTWVKMGKPSLDGLRLALLDGAPLSILRSDAPIVDGADDPNAEPDLWIESVEVAEARYLGRGTPAHAAFSPWLSAIIGGRGTGKSTLVEMVRLGMRRQNELSGRLGEEFQEFAAPAESRHGRGALTDSTEAIVSIRKNGMQFRVRWRTDGGGAVIEEMTPDGEWKTSPGEVARRFPVRILSQKQVFALANDPDALLRLVDDADPVNRRERAARREKAEAEFLSLRSQARAIDARITERERIEGDLADVRRQISVFDEGGHRDLLVRYQRFTRQKQILTDRARELKANAAALLDLSPEMEPADVRANDFDPREKSFGRRSLDLLEAAAGRQRRIAENLREHGRALDDFRKEWIEEVAASKWSQEYEAVCAAYRELMARLAEEGVSDPGNYGALLQRRELLQRMLTEIDSLAKRKQKLEADADRFLEEVETERRASSKARIDFLQSVLGDNPHIRLEVVPFGSNALAAERRFRKAIGREDGRLAPAILSEDGETGELAELFRNLSDHQDERQQELEGRIRKLKKRFAEAGKKPGPSGRQWLWNHLRQLSPEQRDRFLLWWPEDGLEVRYRRTTTGKFVPLERGSPGQKSAAILALLLAYGDEPILLDQPEDDLDNHLIHDLIVQRIRQNKRKRQVIIATHNSNLVVNGDAEMVISMDHLGGQCVVAPDGTGCLQDTGVRAEVCRVMEGGRRAFENRYRRLREEFDDA